MNDNSAIIKFSQSFIPIFSNKDRIRVSDSTPFLSIRPGSIVITIPGAKGISLFGASEGNSCAEQPHPWPILPGRIFSKPASEYTLAAAKYSSLKRIPGFRIEKQLL